MIRILVWKMPGLVKAEKSAKVVMKALVSSMRHSGNRWSGRMIVKSRMVFNGYTTGFVGQGAADRSSLCRFSHVLCQCFFSQK